MEIPKNRGRLVLAVLVLTFLAHPASADKTASEEADIDRFLELQNSPTRFAGFLDEFMSRDAGVSETVSVLGKALEMMDPNQAKQYLLTEYAQLHELIGRIEKAQSMYERAALLFPERILFPELLSSAELLYEIGSYGRSASQARAILAGGAGPEVTAAAEILLCEIRAVNGDSAGAESLLKDLVKRSASLQFSSHVYRLYRLASALDSETETKYLKNILISKFPESPETKLMLHDGEGRYGEKYKPEDYLSMEMLDAETAENRTDSLEDRADIQTGLFRYRDNAEEMQRKLDRLGFDSEIAEKQMEGDGFFSVLIRNIPMKDTQEMILSLKEEGFEGFLVFTEQ